MQVTDYSPSYQSSSQQVNITQQSLQTRNLSQNFDKTDMTIKELESSKDSDDEKNQPMDKKKK